MRRAVAGAMVCAMAVGAAGLGPVVASAGSGPAAGTPNVLPLSSDIGPHPASPGEPTAAGSELLSQGYLVPDQAQYLSQQAAAAGASPSGADATAPATGLTARAATKWGGLNQAHLAPSDSTGAAGPARYIELVNAKYGIYNRTVSPPSTLATGTLQTFTGDCASCIVGDPQVIWDPGTNRFYYAALDFTAEVGGASSSNYLLLGFSKSSTPSTGSTSDWCNYTLGNSASTGFGLNLPDYPKLGDSADFWMVGWNLFDSGGNFSAAQVEAISKPTGTGTITTCPDGATGFTTGSTSLASAFTPLPAQQTDTSSTGYLIARPPSLPATSILLYSVTKGGGGAPVFSSVGSIGVSSYAVPPSAPEKGTTFKIDTSDTRFTQAVSAVDAMCHTRSGGPAVGLWTQHTVKGGAGSEVQWFEINASTAAICQSGTAAPSGRDAFDAAISPDRLVNGSTAMFGSDFVLGYDTSSSTTDPTIDMLSSVGHAASSAAVKVVGATGPYEDGFTCPPPPKGNGVCRWGDYAAATPDPNPALASSTTGEVWLTNMFNANTLASGTNDNWRTENWAARP